MRDSSRRIAVAAALPVSLAIGLTGCGEDADDAAGSPSSSPCVQASLNPDAVLPADVPAPADAVFYEKAAQGATEIFFASIPGEDVRAARETVVTALTDDGYELRGEDAEENVEAEAELEGEGGEVRIQVTHVPNCPNTLRLRYILLGGEG